MENVVIVHPPSGFEGMLRKYIERVRKATNEATKADRFRDFIRRVFPKADVGSISGFYPDIDKFVKFAKAGFLVKGRPDSLFGNLVIEFEPELDEAHVEESYEQLQRYTAAIWAIHADRGQKHERLTCIATDGLEFFVYKPRRLVSIRTGIAPEQIALDEVDRADLRKLDPEYAYQWLHRYIILAASELRLVDPEEFAETFGVGSWVFNESYKLLEKAWGRAEKVCTALYEQWAANLRIVYGSQVDTEPLYLKHTYLATLAKLIVYASYSGGALPGSDNEIVRIIDGTIFKQWSVGNFIEEDFFSWLPRVKDGIELAKTLASRLAPFDLTTVTSDVFKGLYQELVDPEARHDLGEYYTPDWLAQMIVRDILKDDARLSVLDPACGSGTFLASAISEKREALRGLNPSELLRTILTTVVGVDVHPLAVIISRATYITVLGRELLEARTGDIAIPVYLADSIRPPPERSTLYGNVRVYSIEADGEHLFLPKDIVERSSQLTDTAMDVVRNYSQQIVRDKKHNINEFRLLLQSRDARFSEFSLDVITPLYDSAVAMSKLIKRKRDTIWSFIMKNYYKPIFLSKRKSDVLVGNPPWIMYRSVQSVDYQKFLKELIIDKYKLLPSSEVKEISNMEIATLFLVRCADLYLNKGATVGFVMPRGIFAGNQHHNFRSNKSAFPVRITKLIDLKGVRPLFKTLSCAVLCISGDATSYPVEGLEIEGELPKKNMNLSQVLTLLTRLEKTTFELNVVGELSFITKAGEEIPIFIGKGRSPYYDLFRRGGDIYPRPLWFVDFIPHPKLSPNPKLPFVQTSQRANKRAKRSWRDVKLSGNVESDFLFGTLTGSELVPFGHLEPPTAVIPIQRVPSTGKYRLVKREEAKTKGFRHLERWLKKVEESWEKKRGEKAARMNIYQRLDYQHNLTEQNSNQRYKVVYPGPSATYLIAAVVDISKEPELRKKLDGYNVQRKGFIIDTALLMYQTNNEEEAYYLTGFLNSAFFDSIIKPTQSAGDFGPRNIHKKPLEFPIPRFNHRNKTHRQLARIAKTCEKKVGRLLPGLTNKYASIGVIRREVKNLLKDELEEIDKLVKKILKKKRTGRSASNLEHWTNK